MENAEGQRGVSKQGSLLDGLIDYALAGLLYLCALVLLVIAIVVALTAIYSFVLVISYWTGGEVPASFTGWAMYSAHACLIAWLLYFSAFWRIPKRLRERGEAVERARRVAEVQDRIAARGGYSDPRRNKTME